ncbi:MAG: hypothetical protein KF729_14340 [Sandaracinaceae bacterium]|nr:hypothetical protein [Sandaracinaceae bacterium]
MTKRNAALVLSLAMVWAGCGSDEAEAAPTAAAEVAPAPEPAAEPEPEPEPEPPAPPPIATTTPAAGWPADLPFLEGTEIPPGFRAFSQNRGASVLAAVPHSNEAVLASYAAGFAAAGWTREPDEPGARFRFVRGQQIVRGQLLENPSNRAHTLVELWPRL